MPLRAGRRLAAVAGLVLAACTPLAVPRSSPTVSPSASAGELHLLEAEDVQTLDPALIDDPVSLAVGAEMLEGLTSLDPSGRPQPGLASSWEVSDRATTYTFHLRDARYQSGAPVRAQDAIADWSRVLSPAVNSPLAVFFKPLGASHVGDRLAGLTAPDDRTLRIHLAAPDSELLSLLAYPPYWLFDPASAGTAPSGSGPYRLAEWKPGRDLRLEADPGYWGLAPRVTRVRIDIEPDPARRLDLFSKGEADVVHGLSAGQVLDFARIPANRARLHLASVARTTWLGFNTVAGSGYGPQERLAIAQAIDRRRLTDLVFAGSQQARPATDFLPPGVPGHVDRSLPAFDPEAARRSLDQSGFKGPIDLYYSTNQTVGRVATDLEDQLEANTGRMVSLHPLGDFFSQASLDRLPLVIDTWSADVPYPADILENVLRGGAQFNDLHLTDPRIDRALDQGRAAPDLAKALTAYQQAEAAAIEDARVIPLYSGVEPYLVRNGIGLNFSDGPSPFRWETVSQQR